MVAIIRHGSQFGCLVFIVALFMGNAKEAAFLDSLSFEE
jgi:hypothetical protein